MEKSNWLLSAEARPKVEVPKSPHDSVRRFRLPSCIGRPPQISSVQIEAATSNARFGERTQAFFNVGEELEREAEAAELDDFDFGRPLLRRALPLVAASAAFGLSLAFLLS